MLLELVKINKDDMLTILILLICIIIWLVGFILHIHVRIYSDLCEVRGFRVIKPNYTKFEMIMIYFDTIKNYKKFYVEYLQIKSMMTVLAKYDTHNVDLAGLFCENILRFYCTGNNYGNLLKYENMRKLPALYDKYDLFNIYASLYLLTRDDMEYKDSEFVRVTVSNILKRHNVNIIGLEGVIIK